MRKLFTLFIFALGFCSFTFAKTYNTYDNSSNVSVLGSQYFTCGGGENPEKLLDGNINTKWCSWLTGDQVGADLYANRTSDEIVWKTASPIVVTSYTLTTANDTKTHPQRQWKSWTIYGGNFANDDAAGDAIGPNTGWTVIDQVENDDLLPMENHQSVSYNCSYPAEYQYYRLVIDAVHQEHSDHSDIQQMAELTMHYLLASKVTAAPTAKSLTYNGSAQQLVNAGTANGGTMYYRLYNGNWSTSIPTATEAGTYTVYYKVVGDDTHIDSGEGSLNVTIGLSSQYSEGPWTPTDRKTGYYHALNNNETTNPSISWNNLNNTLWVGIATVYKDNTNGIGSQIQATTPDCSKQAIYTLYTATQTIPSYSEMVWNWSFRLSGQYTNLAQQIGLYAGTDLNTLKATALDFTYNNETQAGSDICVGLYSHSAGHPGPSFSAEANHDIRLDNRNGSTDLEQTVYMIQTHIICSYGDANAFGNQWMAFKHLNSSYTYNYYKYITFNANGGSGSMAQQEIENSGTLTANSFTRANCVFTGWNTSADGSGTAYSDQAAITATASSKGPVTLYAQWTFEGNGTVNDPYLIPSTDVWNLLSEKVAAGNNYSGKYFRQTADISVTRMVGEYNSHPFCGIYDGNDHTLTVNYTNNFAYYTAPFRYVNGVSIKNLRTTGSITTNRKYAAGFIGISDGDVTLLNCRSSVEIHSSVDGDGTHGGFVGILNSTNTSATIEGCLFDGKLLGSSTNGCAGFIGWSNLEANLSIIHSLYDPQYNQQDASVSTNDCKTFVRAHDYKLSTVTNTSYYIATLGGAQGKAACSITGASGVTVANAGTPTVYNVSGITSYGTGIQYNNVLYGGNGDAISLTLGGSSTGYLVSAGTLSESGNPYSLMMADADTQIYPSFVGSGTENDPYIIASTSDWDKLCISVNSGKNYAGKFFRQTADISVTTMAGTSDAIPFSGTYDGYGHTLDVTYTSIGTQTGPFRFACGATIKNLHTTGSITTSHKGAGGIIGHAYDENTIINCRSSVEINSSINGDGTHGGLIGSIDGSYADPNRNIIIEGCVFDGKMLGSTTNCWGGFVGWCADNSHVRLYISNSLYAPQEVNTSTASGNYGDWTFSRASNRDLLSITNCYYTVTRGGSQGKERHSITGASGITVTRSGSATTYNVSGITSYDTGIKYNNVLYGGEEDVISLNLIGSSNYKASAGTLSGSGNSRTLTMPASDVTIYGAASISATPTDAAHVYSGTAQELVNAGVPVGGTMKYSTDNSTWSAEIPTGTNVGNYTVYYMVEGDATHADYLPSSNSIQATITKAALTCQADNKSIDYNSNPPTYTATYSGWKGSDNTSALSGTLSFACSYAKGNNAGSYTITPSGVTASNYTITFQTGTLTVNKIDPVVTAPTAKSLTYNGSAQVLANPGSTTGGTLQYSLSSGTGYGDVIPAQTNADTYTVYYKVNGNTNYNAVAEQSVSVTINKAALTCTADNKSIDYNSNPPTYTATYSGWKGSDNTSALSGTLSFACSYAKGSNAGSYTITPSGVTSNNYTITFQTGTLTVNKIDPIVTPPTAKSLTYNGSAQVLANLGSTTGGTMQYSLSSGIGYGDAIPTQTNAGTYTVYYKVNGNTNYNAVAEQSVSVTINKAALTCTADNKSIDYNSNPPTYTATYSGWKGSDNTSVLGGSLSFACSYEKGSNAGSYTITPSGVTSNNYTITFQTGTLTVNKIDPVVTAPTAKSLTYNGSAQVLANAGSTTGGTLQYSLSSGTGYSNDIPAQTNADTYTVYYKVNGNTNYNAVAEQSVSVTINKAALTCTADNKSVTYGDEAPAYTVTYSGWVNGETSTELGGSLNLACTYAAGSNVGDYTITPSGLTAGNYEISFVPGTLTVNQADAAVVSAPADLANEFNGAAQTLISAGSATGGTMEYKVDGGAWSADLPTATNIGNYTIYYKVAGDENHTDVAEASITATIVAGTSYEIPDDVDYSDVLAGLNGQTLDVTIARSLSRDGNYSTLCLPFDLDAAAIAGSPLNGFVVCELTDMWSVGNELRLLMTRTSSIEAGKPYLVRYAGEPTSAISPLVFNSVTVSASAGSSTTANGATMYGILEPTHLVVDNQNYLFLMANNVLTWPNVDNAMKAFRAYFILGDSTPSGAPIRRGMPAKIVEQTETTTDITNVQSDNVQSIKLIRNGQLIIIRGDKEFNAQGQIIK
ncbi:MAG: InlB B-repeat-containing protein [Paludibacteraceae bacterium]|nr:InlB B-repeat-containing protein [Paludibacteraceae bacterium]